MEESVQKAADWYNEKLQKHVSLPMHQDPIVTVADIKATLKVKTIVLYYLLIHCNATLHVYLQQQLVSRFCITDAINAHGVCGKF